MELDEKLNKITEERQSKYGPVEDNCRDIRAIMFAWFKEKEIAELSDEVICAILVALKMSRRKFSKLHDHDDDAINYMKLLKRVTTYEDDNSLSPEEVLRKMHEQG